MREQGYILLPNPNNGNFSIRQALADESPVLAEVWNVVGARVFSGTLYFNSGKANVRVPGLSEGNYLLKLVDSKGVQYTVKFTILE